MTRIATLKPDAPIDEAVQVLLQTSQGEFPVVDDDDKPVGLLGRADIIRALKELGPDATRRPGHDRGCRGDRPPRARSTMRCACCRRNRRPPSRWWSRTAGWSG